MKKWKKVIKALKKDKLIKKYNACFKHKQLRFAFSKIALTYKKNLNINKLIEIEKELLNGKKDEDLFKNTYSKMNTLLKNKWNWQEFGKFMFYIYYTSLYWKAKNQANIFTKQNFVEQNEKKRFHFNNWLKSVPIDLEDFNKKLICVMECVF